MDGFSRRHRKVSIALTAGSLVVAMALAGTAGAATTIKPYGATIAANAVPGDPAADVFAGATPSVAITITNRASEQRLGSVDVAIPAGITVTTTPSLASSQAPFTGTAAQAGGVVQLRNLSLNPGNSATLTFGTRVECSPTNAPYVFSTAVKQSNDFNGSGNDFVISGPQPGVDVLGTCTLAFGAQPADSQRSTNITSEVFLPTGAPVTVRVLDGSGGSLVSWWPTRVTLSLDTNPGALSGYVQAPPTAGVASFSDTLAGAPKVDVSAAGYRFTATSTGLAPTTSTPFDIVDSGQRCVANPLVPCTALTSNDKSSAKVQGFADNDGDILRVSLGASTTPAFECAGYTSTTETLEFDLTTLAGGAAGGPKTVTMTLKAAFATRSASQYDACYSAPYPFTIKSGTTTPGVDTDGDTVVDTYIGLLPNCARGSGGTVVPPCVTSKVRDRAGNIVLTIVTPAGDPLVKF